MKSRFIFENNDIETFETKSTESNGNTVWYIPKESMGNGIKYVDFLFDYFTTPSGSDGYFISDNCTMGTKLTSFIERKNCESVAVQPFIACYGWNRGKGALFAIVTGMRCDYGMVVGIKDGQYYEYPRFFLDGNIPDEDIRVEICELSDGSYSSMARTYRNYQLTRGNCVPLRERVAKDKRLEKSVNSIAVRVRQGWKPVPTPVEEQTPETEPPVHVACDFDRVGDIADEFKKQGIPGAEFCLVGWNIGGHDGRYPQIFPVEPKLGGEERMKALINKVHNDGYGIVCHDDATAAYRIADCFDESFILKNRDGSLHKRPNCWSGGRPYKICPQCQYEMFEKKNQPKLAELGFEGIHYIDVMTILPLLRCYDAKHPSTRSESAEWYRKIMRLSRKYFGGFSSESAYDYAASDLDYCMYTSFGVGAEDSIKLCDKLVPFWELTYHGIILYNPCTYTLNYTAKGVRNRLKYFEFGGRPLVCYYANFAEGNNWMGKEDFICDNDEQLCSSVASIKQMSDDYEMLSDVRYEFMESHEEISPNVFRTVYSNGTTVTVDYTSEKVEVKRK